MLGFQQPVSSGVREVALALQALFVDDPLFQGGRVEILQACSHVVQQVPRPRARLLLFQERPLLVHHDPGVGAGQFLDVVAVGLRHPVGYPEDLGQRAGFVVSCHRGRVPFLHTATTMSPSSTA